MQRLISFWVRGALGLGAAALLLAVGPAHAGPASRAAELAPADHSRESQPLRLAQSKAQQEEAEQLEKRRLKEQQEQEKLQQQKKMQMEEKSEMPRSIKTRSLGKSAPAAREAAPPQPGAKRFGAGVIRNSDPGEAETP